MHLHGDSSVSKWVCICISVDYTYVHECIYIYIYIYIYVSACQYEWVCVIRGRIYVCICIVTVLGFTNSLCGFVANQLRYNLDSAQYLLYHHIYTTPPLGQDMTIFKRSLTGLNTEFSFSYTSCLSNLFTHSWRENNWIHTFPKGISAMWNAISLVQDLNSYRHVHFLRR